MGTQPLCDEGHLLFSVPCPYCEIERLQQAIRKHRDQRGDDRCWMDDEELYRVLHEGYTPPARDTAVELENCRRFIECRQNPATEYVSPEREIERLRQALEQVVDWYDRDGSVGGADLLIEDTIRPLLKEGS